MSSEKRIVLDANILLRAALGVRVLDLIETYQEAVSFFAADVSFADADKYVRRIAAERGKDAEIGLAVLKRLSDVVRAVDRSFYGEHENSARIRIGHRDEDDWPIIATSMLLTCPIWTEDQDFFGSGVATWTTQTIELYLQNA